MISNKTKDKFMGKSIIELIEQLKVSTNPVTDWALRQCIIARLESKELM